MPVLASPWCPWWHGPEPCSWRSGDSVVSCRGVVESQFMAVVACGALLVAWRALLESCVARGELCMWHIVASLWRHLVLCCGVVEPY